LARFNIEFSSHPSLTDTLDPKTRRGSALARLLDFPILCHDFTD
jgi:hypothetical protein